MGEAKRRGTFEQRQATAKPRARKLNKTQMRQQAYAAAEVVIGEVLAPLFKTKIKE
jgi:hypothetical protein